MKYVSALCEQNTDPLILKKAVRYMHRVRCAFNPLHFKKSTWNGEFSSYLLMFQNTVFSVVGSEVLTAVTTKIFRRLSLTFRRNVLPPFSGSKKKFKEIISKLLFCFPYSSKFRMETVPPKRLRTSTSHKRVFLVSFSCCFSYRKMMTQELFLILTLFADIRPSEQSPSSNNSPL